MANITIGISQREVVVSDSKNWRERERELWFPLLQQIKSSQYRMLMLPATAGVWHGWHGIIWSCVVFGFNMFQLFFPLYNLIIGAHRRGHQMVHRQRTRIIGTIGIICRFGAKDIKATSIECFPGLATLAHGFVDVFGTGPNLKPQLGQDCSDDDCIDLRLFQAVRPQHVWLWMMGDRTSSERTCHGKQDTCLSWGVGYQPQPEVPPDCFERWVILIAGYFVPSMFCQYWLAEAFWRGRIEFLSGSTLEALWIMKMQPCDTRFWHDYGVSSKNLHVCLGKQNRRFSCLGPCAFPFPSIRPTAWLCIANWLRIVTISSWIQLSGI